MSRFCNPDPEVQSLLRQGLVIPAHPLALTRERNLDAHRQAALTRYYCAAGAGGIAVGVHTTQFAIRSPHINMFRSVLADAAEQVRMYSQAHGRRIVKIAGVCGPTPQAVSEAELARFLDYDAALLSFGALVDAADDELIAHARAVAEVLPLFGFYLQPAVGGRVLSQSFWRRFAEIENVVAIKIAPFNRYQTLDVVRAVAEVGRAGDIALYTGNDDNIIIDLLTPFRHVVGGREVEQRIVGGLLGQWACWTRRAVELLNDIHAEVARGENAPYWLTLNAQLTDANAALFDAANGFRGCIAGIHEVLRRQGLLEGRWCLDLDEDLSPGQAEEIERVIAAYPHLTDDQFVAEHLDEWLRRSPYPGSNSAKAAQ